MSKREKLYLLWHKKIRHQYNKVKSLARCLATPASFPDSGYYYRGKRREYEREEIKLKSMVSEHQYNIMEEKIRKICNRDAYNYYERTYNGYTAAEMDAQMAYSG